MMTTIMAQGFRTGFRQVRLFVLLWGWSLLLAWVASWPLISWWGQTLAFSPETDRLLGGLHFRVIREMTGYDLNRIWSAFLGGGWMVLLLSFLLGPAISAGTLQLISAGFPRRTLTCFLAGAGEYFWRFLRLSLLGGIGLLLSGFLLIMVTTAPQSMAGKAGWEKAVILWTVFQGILVLLLAGLFLVVLDYARLRIVTEQSNRVLRVLLSAFPLVLFRAPGALWIALVFSCALGAVLAFAAWFPGLAPSPGWAMILLVLLVQQGAVMARSALRVGALAAHFSYFRGISARWAALAALPPPEAETEEGAVPPLEGTVVSTEAEAGKAPPDVESGPGPSL